MFKNIILFPHNLGQLRLGVERTPRLMKNILDKSNRYYEVECKQVPTRKNLVENIQNLYYTNESVRGPRINIGGDHSMSIATVAYSLNKYPNLKVLWFDAHADINTFESSKTKNYHGMPLSFLTGLTNKGDFNFIHNILPLNRLMYVGVRDTDAYEKEIIKKHNINHITMNEIKSNLKIVGEKLKEFSENSSIPIHLSFDVDIMDPALIYSTGTPVNNGVRMFEIDYMFKMLKSKNIVNMDITELNLNIHRRHDYSSMGNTMQIVRHFVK